MKKLITLITIATIYSFCANAKIWRVNNNPVIKNVMTTLQAAHDSASAGDTLMVESSSIPYGGASITKKLAIIGQGYFLRENKDLQADFGAVVGQINFQDKPFGVGNVSTSSGSIITGLEIDGSPNSGIYAQVNNITILRCKATTGISIGNGLNANTIANIIIAQCYVSTVTLNQGSYSTASNIILKNNIITGYVNISGPNNSSDVQNNVFTGSTSGSSYFYNSTFRNNIIVGTSTNFSLTNSTVSNNLSAGTQVGTTNGNQSSVNMANVFVVDPSVSTTPAGYTTDSRWMLKSSSPAIGAGFNGVDAGAFGGLSPYVLSGIPAIPAIYYLEVPTVANGTLDVKMKVRSNK